MSGGHFNYNNFRISEIADAIDELVQYNDPTDESMYCSSFSDKTIEYFKDAAYMLRIASVYANNIDLLVCGDIGEETLKTRLNEELEELKKSLRSNFR